MPVLHRLGYLNVYGYILTLRVCIYTFNFYYLQLADNL